MLILIKVLVVAAWLVMVLLMVFAPITKGAEDAVILYVSDWGPEVEIEFHHTLRALPPRSQLMIVDDGTDLARSRVIERLLVRNPGVIGVRSNVARLHDADHVVSA